MPSDQLRGVEKSPNALQQNGLNKCEIGHLLSRFGPALAPIEDRSSFGPFDPG